MLPLQGLSCTGTRPLISSPPTTDSLSAQHRVHQQRLGKLPLWLAFVLCSPPCPVAKTPFLELRFCPCLLASTKALVPGSKSLWLRQAKLLTPPECGDGPAGVAHDYRLQGLLFSPTHGTVSYTPSHSPLGCLLGNLQSLHLAPHLRTLICSLCNTLWPPYPLDNQSKSLPDGTLDPNITSGLLQTLRVV